jgi:hypothetical protein
LVFIARVDEEMRLDERERRPLDRYRLKQRVSSKQCQEQLVGNQGGLIHGSDLPCARKLRLQMEKESIYNLALNP